MFPTQNDSFAQARLQYLDFGLRDKLKRADSGWKMTLKQIAFKKSKSSVGQYIFLPGVNVYSQFLINEQVLMFLGVENLQIFKTI